MPGTQKVPIKFLSCYSLCACAESLFSLWLFATPTDCSPCQTSLSAGILQARVLEWVAMLSSRGPSQPRNQTCVSCTAGGFFTVWATRKVQEYWSRWPIPSPGDLPNPQIEPRSPTLQADSLPSEPPGKPKNTGVGSLSLLQGIFPTQESNQGILHYRQILYQLSYEGTPFSIFSIIL